jgi:hypothetical protein
MSGAPLARRPMTRPLKYPDRYWTVSVPSMPDSRCPGTLQ